MRMRRLSALLLLLVTMACTQPASAQVSVSIGINLPVFPHLVVVPSYPVYYAPSVSANYFFYDGFYWVSTWRTGSGTRAPGTRAVGLRPARVRASAPPGDPVPLLSCPPGLLGWMGYDVRLDGGNIGDVTGSSTDRMDRWDRNRAPAAAPYPRTRGATPATGIRPPPSR